MREKSQEVQRKREKREKETRSRFFVKRKKKGKKRYDPDLEKSLDGTREGKKGGTGSIKRWGKDERKEINPTILRKRISISMGEGKKGLRPNFIFGKKRGVLLIITSMGGGEARPSQ